MRLSSKPVPGTDLAIDDDDWPYFPPSTVAWSGLSSATDHLDAIRRHLNAGFTFPMAHLTLCRSALILNGLQDSNAVPDLGTDLVAENVAQRKAQLAEKWEADNQTSVLETTLLIRQAAEGVFPSQPELADEAVLVWRSSSGAAHGLPWP